MHTLQQLRKDINLDVENVYYERFQKEIQDAYAKMSVLRRNQFSSTKGKHQCKHYRWTNISLWFMEKQFTLQISYVKNVYVATEFGITTHQPKEQDSW